MGRLEKLLLIASGHLVDDNLEGAIRNFNFALLFDGDNAFTLASLGFAHFNKKEFQDAERFYKHALRVDPDNLVTRNRLAEAYLEQDKFDDASQEQSRILEKNPENIRARVGLGHSYFGMKRYDGAIREYSTAVKQGLKSTVSLGWAYLFSRKKYEREIQVQERIIEKSDIIQAYCGLILAHNKNRESLQSIKYTFQLRLFKLKTRVTDLLYSLKP